MRKLPPIITVFVLGLLLGCEAPDIPSEPINRTDLYGRYVANFGETDINFFDLFPDSTYIFYYKDEDGHLYVDTGRWDLVGNGRSYNLVLYGFQRRYPWKCTDLVEAPESQDYNSRPIDIQPFNIYKYDNRIKVRYCFGQLQYYVKNGYDKFGFWGYFIAGVLVAGGFLAFVLGWIYSRKKGIRVPLVIGLLFFGIYSIITIIMILLFRGALISSITSCF